MNFSPMAVDGELQAAYPVYCRAMTMTFQGPDDLPPELGFERFSLGRRLLKRALFNPFANHLPASWLRWVLRVTKSELAMANWSDPGGWRSMVISYNGRCRQVADRILVSAGTMPTALRNRKRLGSYLIAREIDAARATHATDGQVPPAHVLCLGAGPGQIILDALAQASAPARATLVDINSDAFKFGLSLAAQRGLADCVQYIQADVRELHEFLHEPPDVVKMLGICEYLTDEQIVSIASAVAEVMDADSPIVFNSLSNAHGTDRFFRRVFNLHMIHRSPEEVSGLMAQAGFGRFVVHGEPLGVYHVVVGRKLPAGVSQPV